MSEQLLRFQLFTYLGIKFNFNSECFSSSEMNKKTESDENR
jgi:hypothetical protein